MSVSRRAVLGGAMSSALGLVALGCKRKLPSSCMETTGLQPDEIQARKTLDYRDATPFPDKTCERCQQFVAAREDGACATCKVLRGPVHPYGYCKSFAAKG
jgi:hypothetical protein